MTVSRTKYVVRNIAAGLLCQILNSVLGFIVRYYFIYTLGVEYLGVNGLFTNVLQFLSLVELGIGSTIVYRLYAPLKSGDTEQLKSLMLLYKRAYTVIGVVVFILGLALCPFMSWLINDAPQVDENLYLIFILFVLNSSLSYLYIYKQSIIVADQRNYIVSIVRQIGKIIQSIAQILILVWLSDFILFLIIGIIFTLLINIGINKTANKLYPFLKDNNVKPLALDDKKGLWGDVKSLITFKLGYIILNNANNIILSLILGITYVGLGSNYFLITAALEIIIDQFFGAFISSVGNYNVDKSNDEKWNLFCQLNYMLISFSGLIFGGAFIFSDEFINIWIGSEYRLPSMAVLSIILFIFLKKAGFACYMFRTTQGAFHQARFVPAVVSLVHVCLALILVKSTGFAGVFFSASLAMLSIDLYDSYIVSKLCNFSFSKLFILWLKMGLCIFFCGLISLWLTDKILHVADSWFVFIGRVSVFSMLFLITYAAISYRLIPSSHTLFLRFKFFK